MTQHRVLDSIWQELQAATTQRTGFTLAALATVTATGQPRARSVILRDFASTPERIWFATDVRSAKIAEIRARPEVALTLYDAAADTQLRAEGRATIIEDDDERRRAWQTLAPHSKQLYADPAVPGAPLDAAQQEDHRTAFERFAWVSIELDRLDWLDLSSQPQQRWQFHRKKRTWAEHRVVP